MIGGATTTGGGVGDGGLPAVAAEVSVEQFFEMINSGSLDDGGNGFYK